MALYLNGSKIIGSLVTDGESMTLKIITIVCSVVLLVKSVYDIICIVKPEKGKKKK